MKYLFSLLIFSLLFSCNSTNEETASETGTSGSTANTENHEASNGGKITYKAVYVGDIGWGYQIFRGSNLIIDQRHIPAVNGLHGFSSEEDAKRAAEFVIGKIHEGWDQPSVTPAELDSIGAINLDSLNQISAAL